MKDDYSTKQGIGDQGKHQKYMYAPGQSATRDKRALHRGEWPMHLSMYSQRLAAFAALVGRLVHARADGEGVSCRRADRVLLRFEGLARDDAVYICNRTNIRNALGSSPNLSLCIPVRIVWKAPSTLEASSAEVSMNDNPFSATMRQKVKQWPRLEHVLVAYWRMPLPHLWEPPVGASNRSCFQQA